MSDENFRVELEARKAANMPQLLFKAARLLNERAIGELRERAKLPKLRASHSSLFPHISLEGTRLTDLARAMGISKQAVAEWVDELVEMGVRVRLPDPDDGRAKRNSFAYGGKKQLEGLSLLSEIEGEIAGQLGEKRTDALRDGLAALLAYLEETG